jgi:hypothetical protein
MKWKSFKSKYLTFDFETLICNRSHLLILFNTQEFLSILIGQDVTYLSVPQSELTSIKVYSGHDAAQMMSQ